MKIFVTGATGFLGSHLINDLIEHDHEVAVLLRHGSDTWRIRELLPRVKIIPGDLGSLETASNEIAAFGPEAVAHLAWRGVGNIDRNSPTQAQNIADCVNLAAKLIDLGISAFVGAGSQAEYGPYPRAITEDDLPHPTTLYGHAKLASYAMTSELCRQRGTRFAWLRIFSTYGPKDAPSWLVPSLIRTLSEGKRMALTACEQRWGFLHARDAASAFRLALTRRQASGLYNLGSSDAPPLQQTVSAIRDLVNPFAELGFGEVPYRPDQVMVLQADMRRLQSLGWKQEVEIHEGLSETVAWFNASKRH